MDILPARPASDESFDFLKSQLNECVRQHPECTNREESRAPKRLLYVGSIDEPPHLLRSDSHSRKRYAALSYCWGGDQALKLTKHTEKALSNSISWDDLPVLLRDAIVVCRRLQIDYLWIDSLCITQGDDEREEWRNEAVHMADIYGNAFVTLFSASCSSPRESFLQPCNTIVTNDILVARRSHPKGLHTNIHSENSLDPLEERAWAFQEFHLSPRVIAYTSNEIQWHCQRLNACEPGCAETVFETVSIQEYDDENRMFLRNHLALTAQTLDTTELFRMWHRLVERYSKCQLTFPGDRLVALAGLTSKFHSRSKSEYIAGLWKDNLIEDLLW
ncbi:HET-domain-containing protein, partial [Microthyrium microscopicum]